MIGTEGGSSASGNTFPTKASDPQAVENKPRPETSDTKASGLQANEDEFVTQTYIVGVLFRSYCEGFRS